MKALIACAVFAATVVGGTLAAREAGFVYNHSASMPIGVWKVRAGPATRGDVVLVCPADNALFRSARDAKYLMHGTCPGGFAPLLKPVAAVAGDLVRVTADGASVNGKPVENTRLQRVDGAGRLLPRNQVGSHIVGAGEVWLLSSYNAYSFDSRYFGPLRSGEVRGIARPVLVERR